jgi:glycosyltransferase involved in cell wall biosynthesis
MTISIIIPAYNEEQYIADCLQHCLAHRTTEVKEIIVVDNASTDRTAEVARQFPGVRVVHESRKGLTCARACGLKHATGDHLAFVDADTRISKQWFQQIEREFSRNPALVCLSGPYHFYDFTPMQSALTHVFWTCIAYPCYLCTRYMAIGGNFVAKRSALENVGGFDTSIQFYGEDTDIARRLHAVGRVKFALDFSVKTSGRRFRRGGDGFLKTITVYCLNFLSVSLLHRPVTDEYRDIR